MCDAIDVHDLTKRYGSIAAVDKLNFRIAQGEVVGFLGPNGAGKSTTMRILAGLLTATSGSAYVCGVSVAHEPEKVKMCLGYMPENNPLPEELRIDEYLTFRAHLKDIPWRQVRRRVNEVLEICDLQHKTRRRLIGTLSKGYRQRVGLAEAILGNPKVVFLDEPTVGLDPHQILGIRQLVDRLRGSVTVFVSSHILQEVEISCNRVLIVNHGHIVADGNVDILRKELIPYETCTVVTDATHLDQISTRWQWQATWEKIDEKDGWCTWRGTLPLERSYQTEAIASALQGEGKQLRELRVEVPNLESVFLAATRKPHQF